MKHLFKKFANGLWYIVPIALLTLTDCHCQPRQIVVQSVLLEMPTSVPGFSKKLDREKFSDLVKTIMEKDGHYHFDVDRADGEVLRLSLIMPLQALANTNILLASSLDKHGEEPGTGTKAFADIKVINGSISSSGVSDGVTQVLQHLYQARTGHFADGNIYLEKIEAAARGESINQGDLINAITVLNELNEKRAARSLIKIIESTDSMGVGNACIVALGDFASEDAMPAIINFVERKPAIFRLQAIIAARKIATKTAAEWLLVMAYGHDDQLVRDEAMKALDEVETKLGLSREQ